ncbi:hypothetical protein [Corynebacterium sp. S7]
MAKPILEKNSLVLITGLTGHSLLSPDGSFWDSWFNRLGLPTTDWLVNFIRVRLKNWLQSLELATFDDADLKGTDYVSLIRLHAGLTASDAIYLHQRLQSQKQAGSPFNSETEFASAMINAGDGNSEFQLTSSLSNLVTFSRQRANDIFQRVFELYEHSEAHGGWGNVVDFEGTHNLPEPTFTALTKLFSGESLPELEVPDTVKLSKAATAPTIAFDLDRLEAQAVLGAIPAGNSVTLSDFERTLVFDSVPKVVHQRANFTHGGFEELRVPIQSPIKHLSELVGGKEVNKVSVISDERPYLLLRADGSLHRDQTALHGESTIFLVRESATITASPATTAPTVLGEIVGWKGWRLLTIQLDSVKSIRVHDQKFTKSLPVNRETRVLWDFEDCHLENVYGAPGVQVLNQIPRVTFPDDSNEWRMDYFVESPSGQSIEFDSYVVEDEFRGEAFPVFDTAEEPWIGKIRVDVFRNGLKYQSKNLYLAEDLQARVDISRQKDNGGFRFLDINGNNQVQLSGTTVEFRHSSSSKVKLPPGNYAIEDNNGQRSFPIGLRSDEDYSLNVAVTAPTMRFQIPLADEVTSWSADHQTINTDEVDSTGAFKVRFPTKVHDPEIQIVDARRIPVARPIPLTSTGARNEWACSASLILDRIKNSAEHTVQVVWHMRSKRSHEFKYEYDRTRTVPKERPVSGPAYLSTFTKKPLIERASLEGTTLKISFGRQPMSSVELRVWQFFKPNEKPISLSVRGNSVELPDELVNAGPLVIDAKEVSFLSLWEPSRPSVEAIFLVDGTQNPWTSRVPNRWMFLPFKSRQLFGDDLRDIWQARWVFSPLFGQDNTILRDFEKATSNYLHQNPRDSLSVLNRTGFSQSDQLEALITSGLTTRSFHTYQTGGDIHSVPWIGLIQELNDVMTLSKRASVESVSSEWAESEHYIRSHGSTQLWEVLLGKNSGGQIVERNLRHLESYDLNDAGQLRELRKKVTSRIDDGKIVSSQSYLHAVTELIEKETSLRRQAPEIGKLYGEIDNFIYRLRELNDPTLNRATASLGALTEDVKGQTWPFVLEISFTLALLARMVAHGFPRPFPSFARHRDTWAAISRVSPSLTAHDLVLAEAIVLSAKNSKG